MVLMWFAWMLLLSVAGAAGSIIFYEWGGLWLIASGVSFLIMLPALFKLIGMLATLFTKR